MPSQHRHKELRRALSLPHPSKLHELTPLQVAAREALATKIAWIYGGESNDDFGEHIGDLYKSTGMPPATRPRQVRAKDAPSGSKNE